jgi:hypothetical protein
MRFILIYGARKMGEVNGMKQRAGVNIPHVFLNL